MRPPANAFRPFLVIWAGQLLSRLGSGISAFALGVHLFEESGSVTAFSFLLLCAFLPSVLLAPVGGVLADRNDRKLMMVLGDLGAALGILFVLLMLQLVPGSTWPIYPGVALSSVFVALHSPAFKSAVTDLVDEKAYAKAGGLIQLAEASRYLLAPVIAAVLIARVSLPLVLAIDAASFLAAAACVLLVGKDADWRKSLGATKGFGDELTAGIRYLLGNRFVLHLLYLTVAVTFFTGLLQALFVPIVLSLADAVTLGQVQSIAASGLLLSSLLIGMRNQAGEQKKILRHSLFAAGIFYALIGAGTNAAAITLAAFGFFLALPFVNTSLEVLFRQGIQKELQGRVWSLISLVSQLGMLTAFALAGPLADRVFNPLLTADGRLAGSVGRWIGTGAARGSGLLVIVSGSFLAIFSFPALFALCQKGQQRSAPLATTPDACP